MAWGTRSRWIRSTSTRVLSSTVSVCFNRTTTPFHSSSNRTTTAQSRRSWTRRVSRTGPSPGVWFKVVTKSGETRYYGRTARRTRVALGSSPEVAIWALERVMDAWGNYFEVRYARRLPALPISEAKGSSSRRSTTRATCRPPPEGGRHRTLRSCDVRLRDPSRNPLGTIWHDHAAEEQRLRSIVTSVDVENVNTPAGKYYLTYAAGYQPGMAYSPTNDAMLPTRLTSINYCAGQNCPASPPSTAQERRQQGFMEPLEFEWDGGDYSWGSAQLYAPREPLDRFGSNRELSRGIAVRRS